MDALVYAGLLAAMIIGMTIFAIAEEVVRVWRLREKNRTYAELMRSGVLKMGDLN